MVSPHKITVSRLFAGGIDESQFSVTGLVLVSFDWLWYNFGGILLAL